MHVCVHILLAPSKCLPSCLEGLSVPYVDLGRGLVEGVLDWIGLDGVCLPADNEKDRNFPYSYSISHNGHVALGRIVNAAN